MSDLSLYDATAGVGSRRARRSDRARVKQRRRRRRRTFLSLVVTVVLIGGAVWGAWGGLRGLVDTLTEPDDWSGPGSGQVRVQIEDGDSGQQIAKRLQAAGVVKTSRAFITAVREDTRAAGIQPGVYQLRRQMSAKAAVQLLLDPASRLIRRVTVREGLRLTEIIDLLVKQGFDREELRAASRDPEAIGLPRSAKGKAEGYLFPATYEFQPGTTAAEVLRQMVARGKEVLQELDVRKSRERTILIKASIVQAEGTAQDFGKIARVIENRLDRGMKLQMDSTVNYGTNKAGIFTSDKQRADDNPYNTYLHEGLPAGPIGAPGQEAIEAVLNPPKGDWLYFVVVNLDTGRSKFANTPEGHARNVREWQAWYAKNRDG